MKKSFLLFFLVFFWLNISVAKKFKYIKNLELPKRELGSNFIKHKAYTVSLNEKYKIANWVSYKLTKNHLVNKKKRIKRIDKYLIEKKYKHILATDEDYKGSNYEKGHLACMEDMLWSTESMKESFYYSNIVPQNEFFNGGIWKSLEYQVRDWAEEFNSVYIVTGPIFSENMENIGINMIAVPKFFYKVILVYNKRDIKGIGFIFPHEKLEGSISKYAVTIDKVEKETKIDFFNKLPDKVENELEGNLNIESWKWKKNFK